MRTCTCWFEPTFHKHAGRLCAGLHIHAEDPLYDHAAFRPWRLQALAFKALRGCGRTTTCGATSLRIRARPAGHRPDQRRSLLREWVDDSAATVADLDALAEPDERAWLAERDQFLLYR